MKGLEGRGIAIEGAEGCRTPKYSLSAHLPNINIARPCRIADKTLGKSYLSTNRARTKSIGRQTGVVHPT